MKEGNMEQKIYLNKKEVSSKVEIQEIEGLKDILVKELLIEFELQDPEVVDSLSLSIDSIYDFIDKNFNEKEFKIESVLISGFQSWSKAYEYNIKESQTNIRLKPSLLRFIKSDYEPWFVKKNQFVSSFYMSFFEKNPSERNFTLISKDKIFPTTFIFDKKKKSLDISFGLKGEKLTGKISLDKIYLVFCENLITQKEAFGHLFKEEYESSVKKLKNYNLIDQKTSRIYGWESWYNYYTSITEKDCIKNLSCFNEFIKSFNIESKPVFQIDDGWEVRVGQWQQNEKFPTPLGEMAQKIEENGFLPGIWMAPLALLKDSDIYKNHFEWVLKDKKGKPIPCGNIPLWGGDFYTYDLSIDDARKYILNEVKALTQRHNFKFLKLDFLYAGLVNGDHQNKDHGTAYYYNLFQNELVSALGEKIILLGCGTPLQLSYPFYPITRIGADTREEWELFIGKVAGYEGRPSAYMSLTDTINRAVLNNTVYFSDPDVGFLRKSKIKLTNREKVLIDIIDFIFGSQIMISDDCDDIDSTISKEVACWFSFLKDKEFYPKRLNKKDLYIIKEKKNDIFCLLNLSEKDLNFDKNMLKRMIKNYDDNFTFLTYENGEIKSVKFSQPFILKKHDFIFLTNKN